MRKTWFYVLCAIAVVGLSYRLYLWMVHSPYYVCEQINLRRDKSKPFYADPSIALQVCEEGLYTGYTPLDVACTTLDVPAVKFLLNAGADPNRSDDRLKRTPLSRVVGNWVPINPPAQECAELLIKAGADIDKPGAEGRWTPLIDAADGGNLEAMKWLLMHGAKIDYQDKHGRTALHFAAKSSASKSPATMKVLLDAGADPTLKNGDGKTPADVCSDADKRELLEQHAAAVRDQ